MAWAYLLLAGLMEIGWPLGFRLSQLPGWRVPGIALAKGLPDIKAFADAMEHGYAGATGWFFLRGRPMAEKLNPGHAQIVRVLNLVRRNAEVKEIETALKQDVALSYKLLRYINSAGFGLSCEIESFRHAVTILGYAKLNKWLSLLLVTASRDPSAAALMQTAIARGRNQDFGLQRSGSFQCGSPQARPTWCG